MCVQVKKDKEEDKLPAIMRKLDAICELRLRYSKVEVTPPPVGCGFTDLLPIP